MVPDDTTTATDRSTDEGPDTIVNAVAGAAAAVLLAFLPFSTVLGGAVAGYLEGTDTGEGLRVGTLAGVLALVPLALGAFLLGGAVLAVLPFLDPGMIAVGGFGLLVLFLAAIAGALYTVGLSALGGVLGAYARREL